MEEKRYKTNYAVAVSWMYNNYVMCNKIPDIDSSVFDNALFEWVYECGDGEERETEVYEWYITDASERDVKYLMETFSGLLFTYSNLLECYVLCVDHWGTSWDYVYCETNNEYAERELGERK